jgi:hypothetical protein
MRIHRAVHFGPFEPAGNRAAAERLLKITPHRKNCNPRKVRVSQNTKTPQTRLSHEAHSLLASPPSRHISDALAAEVVA